MQRNKILKWMIPLMGLLLTFQIVSGLNPALVPYQVHTGTGLVIAGVVVFHVILNWPWIRANYLKRKTSG
jgi:heme A synthase